MRLTTLKPPARTQTLERNCLNYDENNFMYHYSDSQRARPRSRHDALRRRWCSSLTLKLIVVAAAAATVVTLGQVCGIAGYTDLDHDDTFDRGNHLQ